MQIVAQLEANIGREMAQIGTGLRESADAAIRSTGASDKARARAVVASALGVRAGNLVDSTFYIEPDRPLVYFRKERWSKGRGRFVLGMYETGGTIVPTSGGLLWIAQPSVARFGLFGGKRQRLTPELFEKRTGLDLKFAPGRNGSVLAFARDARLGRSGRAERVKNVRRRGKLRAAGQLRDILVFVGRPQVAVRKRFDLGQVTRESEEMLARNFIVEAGIRKVVD